MPRRLFYSFEDLPKRDAEMPIFEFRCMECGFVNEEILSRSDQEVELKCRECGCENLERVVSRTNYVVGPGKGGNKPTITAKSCGQGNHCLSVDIPGPA